VADHVVVHYAMDAIGAGVLLEEVDHVVEPDGADV
jgi:hypothetical protein